LPVLGLAQEDFVDFFLEGPGSLVQIRQVYRRLGFYLRGGARKAYLYGILDAVEELFVESVLVLEFCDDWRRGVECGPVLLGFGFG
jgi:hypothetical protein